MPFTDDYSAFRQSVATWIDWTDSTTTQLNDLIRVGEEKVYRTLRVRQMESALNVTINSSGQAAVPADYLELKNAYLATTPRRPLTRTNAESIYAGFPDRSLTGEERLIAREGSNFIFGPAGTTNRVVNGIYYAKPTVMAGGTINSLFSAYPDVFLMAVISEAEPFIGADQRIPIWEAKFQGLVKDINEQDRMEGVSGSPMAPRLR